MIWILAYLILLAISLGIVGGGTRKRNDGSTDWWEES